MFRIPWPFSRSGLFVLSRWLLTAFGGILLGWGLLLWGQVLFVEHIKDEVGNTFFLLRWVGKVSFIFHGVDTKVFLALSEIPDEALAETTRYAKLFLILGGGVGLFSLFLRPPREAGKGSKGSRKKR